MRGNDIDRIVALDDYDVATAASLREHLRLHLVHLHLGRAHGSDRQDQAQGPVLCLSLPRL